MQQQIWFFPSPGCSCSWRVRALLPECASLQSVTITFLILAVRLGSGRTGGLRWREILAQFRFCFGRQRAQGCSEARRCCGIWLNLRPFSWRSSGLRPVFILAEANLGVLGLVFPTPSFLGSLSCGTEG